MPEYVTTRLHNKVKAEAAEMRAALELQGTTAPDFQWHAFGCAHIGGVRSVECLRRCAVGRTALDSSKAGEGWVSLEWLESKRWPHTYSHATGTCATDCGRCALDALEVK